MLLQSEAEPFGGKASWCRRGSGYPGTRCPVVLNKIRYLAVTGIIAYSVQVSPPPLNEVGVQGHAEGAGHLLTPFPSTRHIVKFI